VRTVACRLRQLALQPIQAILCLLPHVLVAKYCCHLPLHRPSQIFEREGIDLDRSTIGLRPISRRDVSEADRMVWIGKATALLELLAKLIGRQVLGGVAGRS
jgi:transposase